MARPRSNMIITVALLPSIIHSFAPIIPNTRISTIQIKPTSLNMVATARQLKMSKIKKIKIKKQKPLSLEEERALLKLAQEYKKIQDIQSEFSDILPLTEIIKRSGYFTKEEYHDAIIQGKEARETLITRNIGLVQYVITTILATRKNLRSLSREDLTQEGCIGLSKAIDKFNPSMYENKFSTYATWWVKSAVLRSITEYDDLVRVPEGVLQNISKSQNAAKRIGVDWDALVTQTQKLIPMGGNKAVMEGLEKMIAKEAGLTLLQVQKAIRAFQVRRRRASELEPWMIPSSGAANEDDSSATTAITSALETLLKPKEMQALSLRYGLIQPSTIMAMESNDKNTNSNPSTTSTTNDKRQFRDYLAEAENDIFGENGIIQTTHKEQLKRTKQKQEKPISKGKWGEAMTFAEIGKQMAISTEYSRRLCSNALLKLQRAVEDGKLMELRPLLSSM